MSIVSQKLSNPRKRKSLSLSNVDMTVRTLTALNGITGEIATDLGGDLVIPFVWTPSTVNQFIASLPYNCVLQSIFAVRSVYGTGTATKLMIRRITSNGVVPGAAAGATCIEIVAAGINLTTGINVLQASTLAITAFSANDRIAVRPVQADLVTDGTMLSALGSLVMHFKRSA